MTIFREKRSSASLPSAANICWARPPRRAMYECGQRCSPGSEAPPHQGDGSDDKLDPTHATFQLNCTWGLWGGVSLYVGTDCTFTGPGTAMLCVCKRTERRPALGICQGPRMSCRFLLWMLRVAGGALCSNILHILLLICYHLSGPGLEEKTSPIPSFLPLYQDPHLRFCGSTEGCF